MRGINTKAQLAETEAGLQQRLRQAALEPASRWSRPRPCISAADTKLGRDVTVEPYVVFGPGVTVEDGAVIRSFSHLDGAHVGKGAHRRSLRAAAARREARQDVHIGNFVEVKEATDRGRRQGQPSEPISATRGSAPAPMSAPAPSPATTTARTSIAPTSARAPSSARIRRWWRRSRSATAPMSGRARSSPRTCRRMRWRSRAAGRSLRRAGPSACASSSRWAKRRRKQRI